MAVKFEETRWEGVGGKGVGYIFLVLVRRPSGSGGRLWESEALIGDQRLAFI